MNRKRENLVKKQISLVCVQSVENRIFSAAMMISLTRGGEMILWRKVKRCGDPSAIGLLLVKRLSYHRFDKFESEIELSRCNTRDSCEDELPAREPDRHGEECSLPVGTGRYLSI